MPAAKKSNIHDKLFFIQQELRAPKNLFNKFGGYSHRSVEGIIESLKPLLEVQKCILTFDDEIVNVGAHNYIKTRAMLSSSDGGEGFTTVAYARESTIKKGFDEPQLTGTASSYARKYALNAMFAIDDTKDSDSQDNTPPKMQTISDQKTEIATLIHDAKNVEELLIIYNQFPDLKNDEEVQTAFTNRRIDLA